MSEHRDWLYLNCQDGKHSWQFAGGRSCDCEDGWCSVPVYRCDACGDYDYGENAEARETAAECERTRYICPVCNVNNGHAWNCSLQDAARMEAAHG